jgi:hypothetical protein
MLNEIEIGAPKTKRRRLRWFRAPELCCFCYCSTRLGNFLFLRTKLAMWSVRELRKVCGEQVNVLRSSYSEFAVILTAAMRD